MSGAGDERLADGALRVDVDDRPCPYLPGRIERDETWIVPHLDPAAYRVLLDRNYRRSGHVVYRPRCPSCTECRQIRVPVRSFSPSRSQRRTLRRNADLVSVLAPPSLSDEKVDLYGRYVRARHPGSGQGDDAATLEEFLHRGCLPGLEIESRDPGGRLLCVSHVDPVGDAWSSVYCYFDPSLPRRSLGTWSVLSELRACRALGVEWYYLGYFVEGARTMSYKARFLPCEVRVGGAWVRRDSLNRGGGASR